MTSGDSAYLIDTNILIYAYDAKEQSKRLRAIDILDVALTSGRCVLSVQVLGEFFNVATRRLAVPLSLAQAEEAVLAYSQTSPLLDLTPLCVTEAIRIMRTHRTSFWDGQLLATARLNRIGWLLSEDLQDGRSYDGVRVINPLQASFDLDLLR